MAEPGDLQARLRAWRDLAMFGLGAGGFVYEVLVGSDRANIIYGSLALMGVAAYLRGSAVIKNGNGNGEGKK